MQKWNLTDADRTKGARCTFCQKMHHTEAHCKQQQAEYSPASSQATQHSLHAQQGTVMQHIDEQQELEPRYLNHGYVVEDDPFLQGCQLPLTSVLKL